MSVVEVDARQQKPSAPSRSHHRRDVQGLRAIAVAVVVANHAFPSLLPGGFTGVDVFFVISGFVITGLLTRELRATNRLSFVRFYVRRGLRLLPALAVMTSVTALVSVALVSPMGPQQQGGVTGFAASFSGSNIALWKISSDYFSENTQTNPFLHTWSLGVEEQFYVGFPLLLLLAWWVARRVQLRPPSAGAIVGVGLVTVASFAFSLATSYGRTAQLIPGSESFAFYMSLTRAWEFGAGVLIALAAGRLARLPTKACMGLTVLGVTGLLAGVALISGDDAFPGLIALLPVLATTILIAAGFGGGSGAVGQFLASRAMVRVGDLSYSWYLWHWPLLVFARRLFPVSALAAVVAVVLSYAVAVASYRWVEQPFRGTAIRFNRRSLRVLTPSVAVPAMLCAGLAVGAQVHWGMGQLADSSRQLTARPVQYKTCLADTLMSQRDVGPCTWGSERTGKPIYLIGDSNAQQYSEGVIRAGELLGRPVIIETRGGCPLVDVLAMNDSSAESKASDCRRWVRDAQAWLSSQRPGTVVLAASGEEIMEPTVRFQDDAGRWTQETQAKSAIWAAGAKRSAQAVTAGGHEVAVMATSPHFAGTTSRRWWHPAECGNLAWVRGRPQDCSPHMLLADEDARQRPALQVDRAVAAAVAGRLVNVRLELCPSGVCHAFEAGLWRSRDALHISPEQSRELGQFLATELG